MMANEQNLIPQAYNLKVEGRQKICKSKKKRNERTNEILLSLLVKNTNLKRREISKLIEISREIGYSIDERRDICK